MKVVGVLPEPQKKFNDDERILHPSRRPRLSAAAAAKQLAFERANSSASALTPCEMDTIDLQDAVVGKLQALLSQASNLLQNFSSITAECDSLRDDVAAAHQSFLRDFNTLSPGGDECLIVRRKEFLHQLSKVLAALQESQDLCSQIESELSAANASHTVGLIVLAVRANARALSCLEDLSHGPYSSSGIVCSARMQHRELLNNVCAHVKRASSVFITKSESSDILLGNNCSLLQGLQDCLVEYAPEHVHVLVDAVTDELAALFTDEVFSASTCIKQEATSAGFFLNSLSVISPNTTGIKGSLDTFADSLGCVEFALRSSFPCSSARTECSLSKAIASTLVHRVGHKLCIFAANCAGDFLQAKKWSEVLQQLPPHAAASSEPAATFWELWADKRSADAVNATQQQLLNMNTGFHLRQCRNAKECVCNLF